MTRPAPPPGVRLLTDALARHGVRPSKALGQNFVVDPNTIRKVVAASGVVPEDLVLEIGAGAGSLTAALADVCRHVTTIERDRRLIPVLDEVLGARANVTVVEADALEVDLGGFGAGRLVANLPYNVAATLVLRVLEQAPEIAVSTVMTQREVGERLAARPGSRIYGQTSVLVRYFARAQVVARISRHAFYPVPNVDSVLVRLVRDRPVAGAEKERFFDVVHAAFSQRRKTLRNSLGPLAGTPAEAESLLRRAGVDPRARPEDLDWASFEAIAKALPG